MRTFTYPAIFEPGEHSEVIVVSFPDVPEAITEGTGKAEAMEMASDALGVALLGILTLKRDLPSPSKRKAGQILITVDASIAAKIAVIEAFASAGISQAVLAERLCKDTREVRRILDPDHRTKLPALVNALNVLGRRLVIGVASAA